MLHVLRYAVHVADSLLYQCHSFVSVCKHRPASEVTNVQNRLRPGRASVSWLTSDFALLQSIGTSGRRQEKKKILRRGLSACVVLVIWTLTAGAKTKKRAGFLFWDNDQISKCFTGKRLRAAAVLFSGVRLNEMPASPTDREPQQRVADQLPHPVEVWIRHEHSHPQTFTSEQMVQEHREVRQRAL